jgi:hypothetical protein
VFLGLVAPLFIFLDKNEQVLIFIFFDKNEQYINQAHVSRRAVAGAAGAREEERNHGEN